MAVDGSKKSKVSTAPPRKINVKKFAETRASELESLHTIVSNRLNNNFRSQRNKRRRTTAYENQAAKKRHRKRRNLGLLGKANDDLSSASENKEPRKVPRRVRRRIELKKNPESGFATSGDGTRRLRTHVWHAKRFTMTKLWGFHLPLGLHGR
jgi:ribonuclease P/MRP protein subunit POP1